MNRKPLRRILSAQESAGVAAIEFALCAAALLVVLAGTVDIGRVLYTAAQLDAAVSAGAQYAANNYASVSKSASDAANLSTAIANVVANANGSAWATATVNVNNGNDASGCYCPSGSPGSWSWGSAKTCGSTCSGSSGVAGQFVTIAASRNLSSMFPALGLISGGAITRYAMVETQ
jgi:Flp pilus assembly protein TadG